MNSHVSVRGFLSKSSRQRQTLASFDYQWRALPDGDAMLSDEWFRSNVDRIVEQITGVRASWFSGKRILDAGCGGGRWSYAFSRMGARVTAVDFSEAALERTRAACDGIGEIEAIRANLLDLPAELLERRFDMVFCFGVLHHTGDTFAALRNVGRLVSEHGLLFLYLYGKRSWSIRQRLDIEWTRRRLAALPFDEKVAYLRRRYPDSDPHQTFDLLSPTINDRYDCADVAVEFEHMGFVEPVRTVASGEVLLRAQRPGFAEPNALLPGGVPEGDSLLWSHVDRVEKARRDRGFEKRFWELSLRYASGTCRLRATELLGLLSLSGDSIAGRRVLVADPDTTDTANELADAGALVTCLAPIEGYARRLTTRLRLATGSLLDDPDAEAPYDVVVARASSVAITRCPQEAIRRLASRLVPGGLLIIETMRPESQTTAQLRRRLVLKPLEFEAKIERLLRSNPSAGIAGAFAMLAPGLPPRLSEVELGRAIRAVGCVDVTTATSGRCVVGCGFVADPATRDD